MVTGNTRFSDCPAIAVRFLGDCLAIARCGLGWLGILELMEWSSDFAAPLQSKKCPEPHSDAPFVHGGPQAILVHISPAENAQNSTQVRIWSARGPRMLFWCTLSTRGP